nr:hypothetical protein [Tanacetum cinerariifolium]
MEMIRLSSRHQNTQQYGAILPIELTNEDIRNTKAYKEYYAYASREAAPKPKASARRKRSGSDSSTTPPTVVASPRPTIAATPKLTAAAKHGGSGTDEGTGSKPGVPDVPFDDSEDEISWNSSEDEETDTQEQDRHDDEGDEKDESDDGEEDVDDKDGRDDDEESENDEKSDDEETREEDSFNPIPRTPEDSEDDGNGEEDQGLRISEEERIYEDEEADELYLAADLSEMELKKILIEKMEGNKSIQLSDEQRNLYKALVDAYEADKTILDSYGETAILKRRREDDDQKGPLLD